LAVFERRGAKLYRSRREDGMRQWGFVVRPCEMRRSQGQRSRLRRRAKGGINLPGLRYSRIVGHGTRRRCEGRRGARWWERPCGYRSTGTTARRRALRGRVTLLVAVLPTAHRCQDSREEQSHRKSVEIHHVQSSPRTAGETSRHPNVVIRGVSGPNNGRLLEPFYL